MLLSPLLHSEDIKRHDLKEVSMRPNPNPFGKMAITVGGIFTPHTHSCLRTPGNTSMWIVYFWLVIWIYYYCQVNRSQWYFLTVLCSCWCPVMCPPLPPPTSPAPSLLHTLCVYCYCWKGHCSTSWDQSKDKHNLLIYLLWTNCSVFSFKVSDALILTFCLWNISPVGNALHCLIKLWLLLFSGITEDNVAWACSAWCKQQRVSHLPVF